MWEVLFWEIAENTRIFRHLSIYCGLRQHKVRQGLTPLMRGPDCPAFNPAA
jgi:hypothetical protein